MTQTERKSTVLKQQNCVEGNGEDALRIASCDESRFNVAAIGDWLDAMQTKQKHGKQVRDFSKRMNEVATATRLWQATQKDWVREIGFLWENDASISIFVVPSDESKLDFAHRRSVAELAAVLSKHFRITADACAVPSTPEEAYRI